MERKVSALDQETAWADTLGGRHGWLQRGRRPELLMKEDLVPKEADALLFRLALHRLLCLVSVYLASLGQRLGCRAAT